MRTVTPNDTAAGSISKTATSKVAKFAVQLRAFSAEVHKSQMKKNSTCGTNETTQAEQIMSMTRRGVITITYLRGFVTKMYRSIVRRHRLTPEAAKRSEIIVYRKFSFINNRISFRDCVKMVHAPTSKSATASDTIIQLVGLWSRLRVAIR